MDPIGIHQLDLSDNNIGGGFSPEKVPQVFNPTPWSSSVLCGALLTQRQLRTLNLTRNRLNQDAAFELANLVGTHTRLNRTRLFS